MAHNRLERLIFIKERRQTVISISTCSDAIEYEQPTPGHADALWWALYQADRGETLTPDTIQEVHSRLFNSDGNWRTCVTHFRQFRSEFTNPKDIPDAIQRHCAAVENNINNRKAPYLFLAKQHIAFEHIHPFPDGNGRVGRILVNMLAVRTGAPLICITPETKQAYMLAIHYRQANTLAEIFKESII